MKLVVQRVKKAEVKVDGNIIGKIDKGFLVLIGIKVGDTKEQADYLVKKLCNLRVFSDENDKMNLSIKDVKGKLLIVSQFTLYADTNKGRRPEFVTAMEPVKAKELNEKFIVVLKEISGLKIESGEFGASMKVSLLNDGPVTIMVEK